MTMTEKPQRLVVLWTTGDREVALSMVLMYTLNAKLRGWWNDVTLIVWGSSSRILAQDTELQDHVTAIRDAGVTLLACRRCAEMLGVVEDLEKLGIDVKYMGEPFTEILKSDARLVTI
jgi:hypothetical protein